MGAEGGPEGAGQDGGSTENERLWTVFQGLVDGHGRTRAARVLGVNHRTVVANLKAGRLSRRMRSAVQAYQESGAEQPEETGRRVAGLEEAKEKPESVPGSAVEESGGDGLTPPQHAHELPGAGVVTLESQPDAKHVFGPAAELVAEWRELRTGGTGRGSRVDRVRAGATLWRVAPTSHQSWCLGSRVATCHFGVLYVPPVLSARDSGTCLPSSAGAVSATKGNPMGFWGLTGSVRSEMRLLRCPLQEVWGTM